MADAYYRDDHVTLYHGSAGDVLEELAEESVDCCIASPPYFGLRDYGVDGQIGGEESPAEYVAALAGVFAEVRRVLTAAGTLWLNLGDSYQSNGGHRSIGKNSWREGRANLDAQAAARVRSGLPPKSLLGIPWRVAFALQDQGWILRNDIIWAKPNAMPESVKDRVAARHEHVFLFTKKPRYWFDQAAIAEPATGRASGNHPNTAAAYATATGRTKNGGNPGSTMHKVAFETRVPGDVWTIPTQPFAGAHFATMPLALAERCVQAGCRPGGVVLDPFSGSGTTGAAAARHGRQYVGIDLNRSYLDLSLETRLTQVSILDRPAEVANG